jgi:acetyl esterase/lipase
MDDKMKEIPTPDMPNAIVLGTPELPGAKNPEVWHTQYGSLFARNITLATITPFLPDPAKTCGTAVIVAPGGGFMSLSMENEGWDVARALADKGIAAFVLKYRLTQTPANIDEFGIYLGEMLSSLKGTPPRRDPEYIKDNYAPQMEDSNAAFDFIRKHAAEYKVDPNRIGMVGFSAGAGLTLATAISSKTAKPAFIGTIYGPQFALNVPADAPPLFDAYAADDGLIANSGFGLIDSWRAAKRPVELHMYEQGGHGFGMYPKTTTSTCWFNNFISWLTMHGMVKA